MNYGMRSFILYAHNVVECQMMLEGEIEGNQEKRGWGSCFLSPTLI